MNKNKRKMKDDQKLTVAVSIDSQIIDFNDLCDDIKDQKEKLEHMLNERSSLSDNLRDRLQGCNDEMNKRLEE